MSFVFRRGAAAFAIGLLGAGLSIHASAQETTTTPAAKKFTLDAMEAEALAEGISRQHVHGSESTFSRWTVASGAHIPAHSHANEQFTLMISGSADVVSGDTAFSVRAGDMLLFPPNVPHEFRFLEDSVAIDFFAPRRQDWIDAATAGASATNRAAASSEVSTTDANELILAQEKE